MAYNLKTKRQSVFVAGKNYHNDTLKELLPNPVILNMFRKPVTGEKTSDGITYISEKHGERSNYNVCIASFTITISILFNNPQ